MLTIIAKNPPSTCFVSNTEKDGFFLSPAKKEAAWVSIYAFFRSTGTTGDFFASLWNKSCVFDTNSATHNITQHHTTLWKITVSLQQPMTLQLQSLSPWPPTFFYDWYPQSIHVTQTQHQVTQTRHKNGTIMTQANNILQVSMFPAPWSPSNQVSQLQEESPQLPCLLHHIFSTY
jgi:hypothetical protein